MTTSEEETVTALHKLFAKIEMLRQIEIRDLLKPEEYLNYEHTLQEAYDNLTTIEDALTNLGMKLEYQHFRLGGAVDELIPLLLDTRSGSDRIMEVFTQHLRSSSTRALYLQAVSDLATIASHEQRNSR